MTYHNFCYDVQSIVYNALGFILCGIKISASTFVADEIIFFRLITNFYTRDDLFWSRSYPSSEIGYHY